MFIYVHENARIRDVRDPVQSVIILFKRCHPFLFFNNSINKKLSYRGTTAQCTMSVENMKAH